MAVFIGWLQVFEKLGPSLFDFLRKNEYRPFPIDLVQDFSRQLLEGVAYMHELRLVHTDLKPENILLVSLDYCRSASVGSGYVGTGLMQELCAALNPQCTCSCTVSAS